MEKIASHSLFHYNYNKLSLSFLQLFYSLVFPKNLQFRSFKDQILANTRCLQLLYSLSPPISRFSFLSFLLHALRWRRKKLTALAIACPNPVERSHGVEYLEFTNDSLDRKNEICLPVGCLSCRFYVLCKFVF